MSIEIYGNRLKDDVLGAFYYIGETTYKYAISDLYPLIQRLDIQRNLQKTSFYSRLRSDLKRGCVVPAITLAYITDLSNILDAKKYINDNISEAFILDGIQRLNAIQQSYNEIVDLQDKSKYLDRTIHLNIIITSSMDKLLYRMITLNNGQKPMSPRHQIDILSETILDFDNLEIRNQSHKQKQQKSDPLAINRSDIIKGYIAYLSNTTAIDNKLIIEEKMDELIAERIIDSDIASDKFEFLDILKRISTFCSEPQLNNWFAVSNNFIGFCVACRAGFNDISVLNSKQLLEHKEIFEKAFASFDKRKIKVGDYRRKLVAEYFGNLAKYGKLSEGDLIFELSDK